MFKPTIGLEVHIELNTKSKMFCSCFNDPNEKDPNVNVCPVCLGHPGTLPVINQEAVKKVIKTGLALGCQISKESGFDRKNYFYPDLPKGYQISQLYQPLCQNGFLKINNKKIRIRKIHLEEDTGRLLHEKDCSLIDFNRAGVALMELVTEPDIRSAKEAREFAEELQRLLRYINVSNAEMEKGQMRVEVNISLTKTKKLGTKVEVKNLNSFRVVERAIDYEVKRQGEVIKSGKKVVQETRGWDDIKEMTFSQRQKEEAQDYRYFPEPDLPPLYLAKEFINQTKVEIPELPQARRERFQKEYNLAEKEIQNFIVPKELGDYFEKTMSELRNWVREIEMKKEVKKDEFFKLSKLCANYLITDLQGLIAKRGSDPAQRGQTPLRQITPENFAEFIMLIYKGKISSKIAKMVLEEMFKTGADPSHIIEAKALVQITDENEIEKIILAVISKNSKAVEDYKQGKTNAFQFLIGQIMAQSKGRANPQMISKLLIQNLTKVK